jgi:hypothetical protein
MIEGLRGEAKLGPAELKRFHAAAVAEALRLTKG